MYIYHIYHIFVRCKSLKKNAFQFENIKAQANDFFFDKKNCRGFIHTLA